jgi:hypothetical protein
MIYDLGKLQAIKQPSVTGFTLPSSVKNDNLDWENSVGLPLTTDKMIVFAPAVGLMDGTGDPGDVLKGPMMAGVIITDQNKVLVMESEPTGGDSFGWTAYLYREKKERKAFLVGEGKITITKGSATIESSVKTVYDDIPGSPGCTASAGVTTTIPTSGQGGGTIVVTGQININ